MNPKQLQSLAAFKKRAKANVCVTRRPNATPVESTSKKPQSECSSSSGAARPRNFNYKRLDYASTKVRFGILAKIIRYLRFRHQSGEDHFLTVEEILDETNLHDVCGPTVKWLATEALVDNPKIEFSLDRKRFRFKPTYRVKDGKAFIRLLKQQDLKGLGGIDQEDVKESLPNCDSVLRKYDHEIITIRRPTDKKKILYYNDKTADFDVDDEFKKMWRMIPVDSMDEAKIEEHLEKQGIRALQGEKPKSLIPKRSRNYTKKKRPAEKPKDNIHVADVLETYDDQGIVKK